MKSILAKTIYSGLIIIFLTNCSSYEPLVIDCAISAPSVTLINVTASTCGLADGSITVSATGNGPITYSIDGATFQSGSSFDQLSSGIYTITAQDVNQCSTTVVVTVQDESDLTIMASSTISGCEMQNATITVSASGGNPDYTYQLEQGTFQVDPTFSSLAAGIYEVTVKDANGCQFTEPHQVLSGITWSGSVNAIVLATCAITGCHVAGTGLPQWGILSVVQGQAALIKTRINDRSMPPVGAADLTNEEIALFTCWIDDGALNN